MNRAELNERVTKTTVEHLGVEAEKVTEEARFVEELGADSLDLIELVMAFEEQFNIEITDDETDDITTYGDAVNLLASKLGVE